MGVTGDGLPFSLLFFSFSHSLSISVSFFTGPCKLQLQMYFLPLSLTRMLFASFFLSNEKVHATAYHSGLDDSCKTSGQQKDIPSNVFSSTTLTTTDTITLAKSREKDAGEGQTGSGSSRSIKGNKMHEHL